MNAFSNSNEMGWAIFEDKANGIFRVNRRAFVDPDVLRLERERIFDRCWIYLGHESEVAQPGDFISRIVVGRPLIMNRDQHGIMHVFFNSCPHRGALVCREDKGRARSFVCPYHGWAFRDDGHNLLKPLPESYSAACLSDPHSNLQAVPRFEVFAGFVFVNFNVHSESLSDYLAGAGEYLQDIQQMDREGMVVVGDAQAYSARANWKLLQENSADGYHAQTTHATYFNYIRNREGTVRNSFGKGFGRVRDLGNGHAVSESVGSTPWGRPLGRWMPSFGDLARDEINRVKQELAERLGAEKSEWLCEGDRNLLIFPNLVVNDVMALTIRTFYPVSPDYFEVNAWALAPKNETPQLRDLRLKSFVEFLGPAGFATPDDQEMLELCQRGYANSPWIQWNDLSRGMMTEDGPAPAKQDELQMRTFWRRWHAMMSQPELSRLRVAG